MVVPLIFGKIAKDLLGGKIEFQADQNLPLIAGFIAAFVTGWVACKWMIKLVKKAKLHYFSYYCFAVGLIAIIAHFI
ncbi:undecaprenyl-diphosphatase [Nonlabens tegetincola]|uniref:Undecaprenyl-diphosphatase n=1 Tax=Nonlabens tegetincola TaxID=323273 RepID=A0A090Q2N4_9FLAO|nr:undecaprenyl-diphosphatase [Nonlabens tegetincola]